MCPAYSYICEECGEESMWFGPYENRPENIECDQCGKAANYTIAPCAKCSFNWGSWNEDNLFRVEGVREAANGQSYCPDKKAQEIANQKTRERIKKAEEAAANM